ncbi:MBL fold metallo-hydrolase [Bacillus sp. REN3]|uniref:MBL fold metallo-hydrolase n=1 Tax=Bacillus sp. REN3 TaxID=2802440 RepID=UPI001AEE196E|nr:MBL fold metallo-hydrolase [Bacillus sp. REN3]
MKWKQIPLGPLQTNCYLVSDEDGSCLVVDPGAEPEKLISIIDRQGLKPVCILLTHAHFDHIGAVDMVREKYDIPVHVHFKEADWLDDPALNGSKYFMMQDAVKAKPAENLLGEEGEMTIDSFTFSVFYTPGHSPGSVSFYFPEDQFVLAGDALFKGSIGRTDLPGGNHSQLISSIHEKLLVLPEGTAVLPGHGPVTSIGDEMDTNPFLNGF